MIQDPTGQPVQGAGAPPTTFLPSAKELLLAEALQPLPQDPVQQQPQGPAPRLPLPQMDVPRIGPDSPAILSRMSVPGAPPPTQPFMSDLPPTLPADPAAAQALLSSIPQMLMAARQRQLYQQDLMLLDGVRQAPEFAAMLQQEMRLKPEQDYEPAIADVEQYLPKSRAQELRASQSRIRAGRDIAKEADARFEKVMREQFSPYLRDAETERQESDLRRVRELEQQAMRQAEAQKYSRGSHPSDYMTPQQREEYVGLVKNAPGLPSTALRDIGRGMGSIVTNDVSVGDVMHRALQKEADSMMREYGLAGDTERFMSENQQAFSRGMTGAAPGAMPGTLATNLQAKKLPPGWTEGTLRALLSDAAYRALETRKRDTSKEDFLSGASSVIGWMPIGMGEVGLSARAATGIGKMIAKVAPKLVSGTFAKIAKGITTYVAGPGTIEGIVGYVQPLPGEVQNRVDAIEDPKLRETTEGAYRIVQATQNAALSALFSVSDVFRFYGRALGGAASKIEKLAPPSLFRRVVETVGLGGAMPAAAELTHKATEAASGALATGDVSKADVLADLYASRGFTGAAENLISSIRKHGIVSEQSWQAVKDYIKTALPAMTGIGILHVGDAVGMRFGSRKAMLDGIRRAEADLEKRVEKGDMDRDVADKAIQILREKAEAMAPTHSEDERRAAKERAAAALGSPERADAAVQAEAQARELLPDVPGDTLRSKLNTVRSEPGHPNTAVAEALARASDAGSPAEVATHIAVARQEAGVAPRKPIDEAAIDVRVGREARLQEEPGAEDAVLRDVATAAERSWQVVHHAPDEGSVTLRAADDPNTRVTIDEEDLPSYRLEEVQEATAEPDPSPVVDDLLETAREAVAKGINSPERLQKVLGVGKSRAEKLFEAASREPLPGETGEAQARALDLRDTADRLDEIASEIAGQYAKVKDIEVANDFAEEAGQLVNDWGDLAYPGDGERGSFEAAARFLHQLPKELQTDDFITTILGLPEEAIPEVRQNLAKLSKPAVLREPSTAAFRSPDGGTDQTKAATGPELSHLDAKLRAIHEQAGGDEAVAAEAVFAQWKKDNGIDVGSHADLTRFENEDIDAIEADLKSPKPKMREVGFRDLTERLREFDAQDEYSAMLSLTADGRRAIQRLLDLKHSVLDQGKIDLPPGKVMSGIDVTQELFSTARRAVIAARMLATNPAQAFLEAKRMAGRFLTGTAMHAWRVPKRLLLGTKRQKAWGAANVAARAATVAESTGAVGSKSAFWRFVTDWMDRLSSYREPSFVLMAEEAGYMARVAHEASNRLERLFGEGTEADQKINEWLESPSADVRAKIEAKLSEPQREVLKLIEQMYGSVRRLVALDLLPDQMMRKQHIRVLNMALAEHTAVADSADAAKRQAARTRDAAAHEAQMAGLAPKDSPTWKEADRELRNLKSQAKWAREWGATTQKKLNRLEGERMQQLNEWGITENYAPAVLGRMPSPEKLKADLAAAEKRLKIRARDAVFRMMPSHVVAKHWYAKKGVLEAQGVRDASGVRSFFHYMRELYRLIPVTKWQEENVDRIYGKLRLVSTDEMLKGQIDDGVREVEFQDFESGQKTRRNQFFRLGGSVYTLTFEHVDGRKKEVYFRTLGDMRRAQGLSPSALDVGPDAEWKVAKDQMGGARTLLLPSARATSEMQGAAYVGEKPLDVPVTEEAAEMADLLDIGPEEEKETRRLVLPKGPDGGFAGQIVWPSKMVGKLTVREAGKIQKIRAKAGEKAAYGFAKYIEDGLQTAMGRTVYTRAQRWAAHVADIYRHGWMGLLTPFSAIKEVIDTTVSNGIWMGFDNAMRGAGMSMEFAARFRRATRGLRDTKTFLQEHTPRQQGGKITIVPPSVLEGIAYSREELAAMSPDRRSEARIEAEAFHDFLSSFLSGESIMEHFVSLRRDFRPGEKLSSWGKKVSGAMGKASWWLRHKAQTHSMRQTWFGSYMAARDAGLPRQDAAHQATQFAMANGNIGNRLSQGAFFQTWFGNLLRPATSWNAAVSSTNWRWFFPGSEVSTANLARALAQGGARAVSRFANWAATAYLYQQLGILTFGYDTVRHVSNGLSEIPLVGPDLSYLFHKLQSFGGLVSDPADASRKEPGWRSDLRTVAKEHAPEILQNWAQRVVTQAGGLPADVAAPMLWGTWIPGMGKVMASVYEAAKATYQGDDKKADSEWNKVIPTTWMSRIFYGSRLDPTDANYVLVTNKATGVTNKRVKIGDWPRIVSTLIGVSVEDAQERIQSLHTSIAERNLSTASKSRSYRIESTMREAIDMRERAKHAGSPEGMEHLIAMAEEQQAKFTADVLKTAREQGMSREEARAYAKRLRKTAEQNYALTASERDIIHSFDTDTAFQKMTAALNNVYQPMTQDRWNVISRLWYQKGENLRSALRGVRPETVEAFSRAYQAAQARWELDKADRK